MLRALLAIAGIVAAARTSPTGPSQNWSQAFNSKPLWRGKLSFENLTFGQRLCLMHASRVDSCKVMDALIFCGEIDGGWNCLSQLPEIGACSQVCSLLGTMPPMSLNHCRSRCFNVIHFKAAAQKISR